MTDEATRQQQIARRDAILAAPKAFSYTYTKLRGFEECGRKHKAQLDKLPGMEATGDAIDYGNRVHLALKEALKDGKPLPVQMRYLQHWVDTVNHLAVDGAKYVEEKWGLTDTYQPTEFFRGSPWLRLIVDVAIVGNNGVGILIDWKTGNRQEEPLQLWLGAAVMFAWFPELHTIHSSFVWLKEDNIKNAQECMSRETIKREQVGEIWANILPRVATYRDALETNTFYPSPGRHCRYCRVVDCKEREQ